MSTLISLDEYYNKIGKELFAVWSEETVYYFSERKNEVSHLREYAIKAHSIAINRIWLDGNVKVSLRLEQGYIDPPFVIEEFYFAQSVCVSKSGDYYRCKLEINKGNRGRPKVFNLEDTIREYVREHHIQKRISTKDISPEAVISYVKNFLKIHDLKVPHDNTIRNRLRMLHPECTKTSRNSKK